MENPVAKFGGNIDAYYEYTKLFAAICATLGEDYAIHKQDIFTRKILPTRTVRTASSFQAPTSSISKDADTPTLSLT